MEETNNACRILVGRPEGESTIKMKCMDNVKMDLRGAEWSGWNGLDCFTNRPQ
jgi:hypothetical protein